MALIVWCVLGIAAGVGLDSSILVLPFPQRMWQEPIALAMPVISTLPRRRANGVWVDTTARSMRRLFCVQLVRIAL